MKSLDGRLGTLSNGVEMVSFRFCMTSSSSVRAFSLHSCCHPRGYAARLAFTHRFKFSRRLIIATQLSNSDLNPFLPTLEGSRILYSV